MAQEAPRARSSGILQRSGCVGSQRFPALVPILLPRVRWVGSSIPHIQKTCVTGGGLGLGLCWEVRIWETPYHPAGPPSFSIKWGPPLRVPLSTSPSGWYVSFCSLLLHSLSPSLSINICHDDVYRSRLFILITEYISLYDLLHFIYPLLN